MNTILMAIWNHSNPILNESVDCDSQSFDHKHHTSPNRRVYTIQDKCKHTIRPSSSLASNHISERSLPTLSVRIQSYRIICLCITDKHMCVSQTQMFLTAQSNAQYVCVSVCELPQHEHNRTTSIWCNVVQSSFFSNFFFFTLCLLCLYGTVM